MALTPPFWWVRAPTRSKAPWLLRLVPTPRGEPLEALTPSSVGRSFNCGGAPSTLGTWNLCLYFWSTGSTDPTITVGTGSYAVTVTGMPNGCVGTSAPVNVLMPGPPPLHGSPSSPPSMPGSIVQFTDASRERTRLVDWSWDFGDGNVGQVVDHGFWSTGLLHRRPPP